MLNTIEYSNEIYDPENTYFKTIANLINNETLLSQNNY